MTQPLNLKRLLIPITTVCALTATACSREPQPMIEAVKPAQQTLEKAREVEQTLQKAQDNQQKAQKE